MFSAYCGGVAQHCLTWLVVAGSAAADTHGMVLKQMENLGAPTWLAAIDHELRVFASASVTSMCQALTRI